MSGKLIATLVALIIVIIGGVYIYMQFGDRLMGTTPPTTENTEQPTTTPQVAGQDAVVGTGEEAVPGAVVSVLYVGMLQDGTVFDSSANNNNQPLTFTLGTEGIIPGFQIGVHNMRVGGERRISIPPELGYGAQEIRDPSGNVLVPANSTLIFDIRLVAVGPAATSTAPTE